MRLASVQIWGSPKVFFFCASGPGVSPVGVQPSGVSVLGWYQEVLTPHDSHHQHQRRSSHYHADSWRPVLRMADNWQVSDSLHVSHFSAWFTLFSFRISSLACSNMSAKDSLCSVNHHDNQSTAVLLTFNLPLLCLDFISLVAFTSFLLYVLFCSFTSIMQESIRVNPSMVTKLRATFLKVRTICTPHL